MSAKPRVSQLVRQSQIAELLLQEAYVSITELVELFQVSSMTIHRDLSHLEAQGILRKVKGGATAEPSYLFDNHFPYRAKARAEEKQAIAVKAMSYIEPGEVVIFDDSTTVLALAKQVTSISHLTVITNLLPTIETLRHSNQINLICLGGDYLYRHNAFVGSLCEQAIGCLRANTLFMSTSAVSDGFAFHQEEDIARVKRAMIRASTRRILLLDHTKLGKQALREIAPLTDFDLVIVDSKTPADKVNMLADRGINVTIAPSPQGLPELSAPPAV